MIAGQTLYDDQNNQVALFPMEAFQISQPWWESGHGSGATYYATDFLGMTTNGTRVFRAPMYAPVDIKLLWTETSECVALWQSVHEVHFADGSIDYLGIIVYHDNDIINGTYSNIGDIKRQGEIFNRTGTGGNVTGDHVHLETGKGEVNLAEYRYHFTDNSSCRRIVPDDALFINDTTIIPSIPSSYDSGYHWKTFQGGHPSPTPTNKNSNKWLAFKSRKIKIRMG